MSCYYLFAEFTSGNCLPNNLHCTELSYRQMPEDSSSVKDEYECGSFKNSRSLGFQLIHTRARCARAMVLLPGSMTAIVTIKQTYRAHRVNENHLNSKIK
jgi:hypothetical protein